MANYGGSTVKSTHKTLAAGVEDVVTLAPTDQVIVTTRNGLGEIYWTTDNTPAVALADNAHMVPAVVGAFDQQRVQAAGRVLTNLASTDEYHPQGQSEQAVVVRLISGAATSYTVEIVQ